MPSRTLREGYATSEKVAEMAPGPQDRWPRYFLIADDFGCFRVQIPVIKGKLWVFRPDMTPEVIEADLREYERVGSLIRWKVGDKTYAWFTGWWEHNRIPRDDAIRKTPRPPHENGDPPPHGTRKNSNPSNSAELPTASAAPQTSAADPHNPAPAVAVSSQSHSHTQDPPVAPRKPGGGNGSRLRLPKRKRAAVTTLAEDLELQRRLTLNERSKALHAWLAKESEPVWDADTNSLRERAPPPHDAQLAWVQQRFHVEPPDAEAVVAIVEQAVNHVGARA